jgi:hypothetical protein
MAARTLTDGEREIVAELNADAYADTAEAWDEVHAGCDVEPCSECESREALDAQTYDALIDRARVEYERDYLPEDPGGDDYPF